ncbi:hypothetical protein MM300_19640 [Evansella sp. LMS18]|jgi:hypothetical protein|uniref:hypothetical protein n=1 Tax=Evansella sp. LMS18 TaxID=2924033 RepID=UPI0020D14B3B|nr:hypothetical protein [Evansella sp. LMS18]UTR10065.1 hypothetical protein MM300_19640 [Evansella sp. LMS18]
MLKLGIWMVILAQVLKRVHCIKFSLDGLEKETTMDSERSKRNTEKDENNLEDKKGWKIFDAIFSAGIFKLFFESEEARKGNNDKLFKELIYGSLAGILIFILIMVIAINF